MTEVTSTVRQPGYLLPELLLRSTYVLFRVLVESLFTAGSAEVILLAFVLRSSGCLFLVHLHLADWIDCHRTPPQFSLEHLVMSAAITFRGIPQSKKERGLIPLYNIGDVKKS